MFRRQSNPSEHPIRNIHDVEQALYAEDISVRPYDNHRVRFDLVCPQLDENGETHNRLIATYAGLATMDEEAASLYLGAHLQEGTLQQNYPDKHEEVAIQLLIDNGKLNYGCIGLEDDQLVLVSEIRTPHLTGSQVVDAVRCFGSAYDYTQTHLIPPPEA